MTFTFTFPPFLVNSNMQSRSIDTSLNFKFYEGQKDSWALMSAYTLLSQGQGVQ